MNSHLPSLSCSRATFLILVGVSLACFGVARAEIVPADRLGPWRGNVGVPGGIPNRTAVGVTVDAATYGDGATDASAAISDAIANCGANKVVYLPPGTYLVRSRVLNSNKSNYTLRGAGPGRTIIKSATTNEIFHIGSSDWPFPTTGPAVTGGATAGSTVLTLDDTSAFAVGKLCHIAQNNPSYVVGGGRAERVVYRVAAKTATTITLNHPLPRDFSNSPILVPYSSLVTGVGVEDLTIDCNNSSGPGIYMEQVWGSWIKNVEVTRSSSRQLWLIGFNQSEIRHCYTHDSYTPSGPNHEGIDVYNNCSWNLIEDNICVNGGFPQIILGDGVGGNSCNVIAYNFCKNAATATDIAGADISFNHGPHNSFNLAEGNVVGNGISSDGYYGSSSHNTMLRNWAAAKPYTVGIPVSRTTTNGLRAIQLNRMSNYYNVIGNVLGDASFSTASNVGSFTSETSGYPQLQLIYQLGYPNLGNTAFTGTLPATDPPTYAPGGGLPGDYQELDLNVKSTLIRHGNYDYYTHAQAWDSGISDHNIPNSYYLPSKPGWFGDLAWPPIDPASPPGMFNDDNITRIPAGYRYVNGVDAPGASTSAPSAPTGLQVVPH